MKTTTKYRIYYADTDHGRIMYYANALKLFEIGRTEFLREHAKSFSEYEKGGYGAVVVEAHIDFKKPIHYDDALDIETELLSVGDSSMKFANKILCKGDLKIEGYCILVFVKFDKKGIFTKASVPQEIRKLANQSS